MREAQADETRGSTRLIREDPRVALVALMVVAVLGVIAISGGLVIAGLQQGAFLAVVTGILLVEFSLWAILRGGRIIRRGFGE